MDNPYQAPAQEESPPSWAVRHVRIVAVLMVIQGALEIPLGMFFGLIATVFPVLLQFANRRAAGPEDANNSVVWFVTITYGVLALLHIVAGLLHLVAGWRNYRFRGRTLGFVALWTGIVTLLIPLCTLTALGLLIYGMMIYLDESVEQAFQMGERGHTADDIKSAFY